MKDEEEARSTATSTISNQLLSPQVNASSQTVTLRLRPSLLPKLLPSTLFIDYPTDIQVPPRHDLYQWTSLPHHDHLLAYKCYWERGCIRSTFKSNGFQKKTKGWTIQWHKHCTEDQLNELNSIQKVNHFAGSWCVGRKDRLARTMNASKRIHGKEYDFTPESFILPNDREAFLRVAKAELVPSSSSSAKKRRPSSGRSAQSHGAYDHQLWILKPVASSCGRGISVVTTEQAIKYVEKYKNRKILLQRYLSQPYLIDGKKFDLRIYVLVSGIDPLRIYIYEEGLTRLSTSRWVFCLIGITPICVLFFRLCSMYGINLFSLGID